MLGQLLYLQSWFFKVRILGKRIPLQTVLFITDHCNLSCKHCTKSGHAGTVMKSYDTIKKELERAYQQGARFVDFQGGEPTLWHDEGRKTNDLVKLAKSVGYFSATITTNGQMQIKGNEADSIWVSVDGYGGAHDLIRGEGTFEILDRNIRESGHKDLSINMAINRLNRDAIEDTVKYAKDNPYIKLISLNFHTPYPGVEDLALPWDERCRAIDEIISLKRQGYPIMNSRSGLEMMKKRDFERDCWLSSFILADGTYLSECPGKTLEICRDCGFCMAGETYCVLRFKPDTIISALKLRVL